MIISLSGKKQSGKSTCAFYLINSYGFVEVSWAQPLKEVCRTLFGLSSPQLYGSEQDKEKVIEEWGMSSRTILQKVGTDLFRKQIADDFWVRLGVRTIKELTMQGKDVVISDSRFPNEVEAVRELGGVAAKIVRLTNHVSDDLHASETALDNYNFDYLIEAEEGNLNSLYNSMDRIVKENHGL